MYRADRPAPAPVAADPPTPPHFPPGPPPAASFTDPHGRRWGVTLTADVLAAFRDECGIDLDTAIRAGQAPAALGDSPDRLVMLLWCACREQAGRLGMTPEAFGRSVFADSDPAAPARPRFRADVFESAIVAVFRALGVLYRPIDKPYLEEMKRMAAFLDKQPEHQPTTHDDFRLNHNPFLFKLCPKHLLDPFSTGPMPGMYLPYDYWKLLLDSDAVKGVKGGLRVTYENARRWISNSLFVSLVQHGWVGTPIAVEQNLSEIIQRSLAANKSVVYASSSQSDLVSRATEDDELDADWDSLA